MIVIPVHMAEMPRTWITCSIRNACCALNADIANKCREMCDDGFPYRADECPLVEMNDPVESVKRKGVGCNRKCRNIQEVKE